MANNRGNNMSREEAGRMGGEATSNNHEKEFYQEIGKKGEMRLPGIMIRNFIKKSAARVEKPVMTPTVMVK